MELFNGTLCLSGKQITGLSGAYIFALSFSVIGSFSILVVSIVKRKNLKDQVQPLVQLALADLLATLILMCTSAMNVIQTDLHIFNYSVVICEHALPLSLTFYLVSFLLLVVYAWESKISVEAFRLRQGDVVEENHIFPVCLIYERLLPIVGYVVYVLTPHMTTSNLLPPVHGTGTSDGEVAAYCTSCILFLHIWNDPCSDEEKIHAITTRIMIFLAVILVPISCSVVYYKLGSWYRRYEEEGLFPVEGDGRSRKRLKGAFTTLHCMVLVIMLLWMPALVLIVMSFPAVLLNVPQEKLFPLYIIQAVTVSLHGCANSLVYGWRRRNFREAILGEHTPLLEQASLAYFEESLRGQNLSQMDMR
ncbi:uncharacterized protein FYW47_009747 [Aplochiton taeniatus]